LTLTPPLLGRISETASALADTVRTIIETGFGSASAELAPAMDIMKELALQMVQQFFVSMKSCIELVLSGRSFFEFARTLLENQIENIHHTGGRIKLRHI